MLRFMALIVTMVMTLLGLLARRVAEGDVPVATPVLDAVLPGAIGSRTVNTFVILILQLVCYSIAHSYLRRLYGFATGETDAAPRSLATIAARGRLGKPAPGTPPPAPVRWRLRKPRTGAVWSTAQRVFATPTGGWLRPFTIPLGIIVFIASPLAFTGDIPAPLWGLCILFVRVLGSVRRQPDDPEALLEPERAEAAPALTR